MIHQLITKYSLRISTLYKDYANAIKDGDIKHAEMIHANINDTEEVRRDLFNLMIDRK